MKAFARVAPHSEEAQLLSRNQAEFEKIQKLWDSALKNAARNSRTLGTIETDGKGVNKNPSKLGDIISHPDLFKAYPQLADIEVKTIDDKFMPNSASAAISPTGDEIIVTPNYQNKGYDRYVIAAYGKIDGTNAVLGAVVKSYDKHNNKFYLHEVEIIKADVSSMTAPQLSVDTVNTSASVDSISNSDENVKQFSLRDSDGNTLSEQQAEYFKDSKIRDEDGNLLVVYHGSDADFTVFDKTKGRANMDIQGSFFSPWDIDAGGYGGNVRAFYLNIKNPAPEGIAYKALNRFKGQNNAGIKAREYLESLGYDGVNNGDEEYIAFNSNQIKEISNTSPTSDADIRFSLRDTYDDTQTLAKDLKKELNSSLSATELNNYLSYLVTLNADVKSSEDYDAFRDTVRNYADAFVESSNIKEEIDDSRRKELAFYSSH